MTIACAQCATELEEGSSLCNHCGAAVAAPPPPSTETAVPYGVPTFSTGSDLEGIGGWLILVALGLAVAPFNLLKGIYADLRILYSPQYQVGLSMKPGLASLILFEAVSNSVFFLALIVLNFFFYRKKKAFPGWMITYLAFNCAVILLDHVAVLRYNHSSQMLTVVRSLVVSLVWIPYYLRSERVKATFVN